MPLEPNIEGSQAYIATPSVLNRSWPDGSVDYPNILDNNIRGLKNVLLNTFPNLTGAVTLTHTQINRGSVPVGTVCIFFQAAAPEGWERLSTLTTDYLLRVLPNSDTTNGGKVGGADNPIIMDHVPDHTHAASSNTASGSHQHTVSGTTASVNDTHTHGGTTDNGTAHQHTYRAAWENVVKIDPNPAGVPGALGAGSVEYHGTDGLGQHSHAFVTNPSTSQHTHSFSVTSGAGGLNHSHTITVGAVVASGRDGNWLPRYANVIICRRK